MSERHYRTIGLGTVSGLISNMIAVAAGIVTVPLLIRGLGVEPYGLLGVVSSLVGFVGIADLGMTNTVTNAISYARVRQDWQRVNRLFSGGIILYVPMALFIIGFVIVLIYSPLISLGALLSIDAPLEQAARPVIAIMLLYTAIGLYFGGMLKSLYHGLNNVYIYNIVQALYVSVFSSVFILYLLFGNVTLVGVVLFQAGGSVVRISLFYIIAKFKFEQFAFSWSLSSVRDVMPLLKYTIELFLLVLTSIIVYKSDNIVLSHYMGVGAVAVYSITFKLFRIPSDMLPIATASLPTVAGLYERRDWSELAKLYHQILRVNVLLKFTFFCFMAIFAEEIVRAWVGADLFSGYATVAAIGGFYLLFAWNGSHVLFTNAMFKYRVYLIPSIISVILNLAISIYLVQRIGMVGIALGTLISFLVTTVWYIPWYLKSVMDIHPFREALQLLGRIVPLFGVLFGLHYLIIRFIPAGIPLYGAIALIGVLFALLVFYVAFTARERKFVFAIIQRRRDRFK